MTNRKINEKSSEQIFNILEAFTMSSLRDYYDLYPKVNVLLFSTALRCGSFSEKTLKKSTCSVMKKIVITFANQTFKMWSKFQKILVCKKLDKRRESLSPKTDNFLAFFIVFQ